MPQSLVGKIQFVEAHLADWAANASQIGSTSAEVTALQTKTSAARAALTAQETAQETAKTKTAALREAVDVMARATSALIIKVRAKAAVDGAGIYQLANIPAPATPTPVGKPGTPFKLKVELKPTGALALSWKCTNPAGAQGTFYYVYRKLDNAPGAYDFLGASGQRDLVDETVPAGTALVCYQIQAARTSSIGDAAEFMVNLGVSSAGATTVSVTEQPQGPKIAA